MSGGRLQEEHSGIKKQKIHTQKKSSKCSDPKTTAGLTSSGEHRRQGQRDQDHPGGAFGHPRGFPLRDMERHRPPGVDRHDLTFLLRDCSDSCSETMTVVNQGRFVQ